MDQSTYLPLTRWAHAPAEREDFSDNESTYDGAEKHQDTEDPVIFDAPKRKGKKKRKRKKRLDIISKIRACPKPAPPAPSFQRHAPPVPRHRLHRRGHPPVPPSVGSRKSKCFLLTFCFLFVKINSGHHKSFPENGKRRAQSIPPEKKRKLNPT